MIIEDQLRALADTDVTLPAGLARTAWGRGQRRHRRRMGVAAAVSGATLAGASLGGVALVHNVSALTGDGPATSLGTKPGKVADAHPGRSRRIPHSCSETNGTDPLWNPSTTLPELVKLEPAVAATLRHVSLAMPVPGFAQQVDPRTRLPFKPGHRTSPLEEDSVGPACGPDRNALAKEWDVEAAGPATATRAYTEPWVDINVDQHLSGFMTLNRDGTFSELHDPVLGHASVLGVPALVESPDAGSPTEKALLFTVGSVDVMIYSDSASQHDGQPVDKPRMATSTLVAIANRLRGLPKD